MKTIYLSLLSLALIGQATYFYCDYQAKQEQAQLNASFREKAIAELSKLKADTDAADAATKVSEETLEQKCKFAIKALSEHTESSLYAAQQKNESLLNAVQAQAQSAATHAQSAATQAQSTVAAVEDLKNGALAELKGALAALQGTETELVLLKKEQIVRANEIDNRWRKQGKNGQASLRSIPGSD
jgi:hypothetical protein